MKRRPRSEKQRRWLDHDIRGLYLDQHGYCQVCRHVPSLRCEQGTECVHHIWSFGQRPDRWTNLVTVCRAAHSWLHDNLTAGRIVCQWVKLESGQFDRDVLREIAGRDPVGFVSVALETRELPEWVFDMGTDFVERF